MPLATVCVFDPERSFNTSSMDGLSQGLLLVQSKATSTTTFISSWIESDGLTSFSWQISLKRVTIGLACMLPPAFFSLPFVNTSRTSSPKLKMSVWNSSFRAVLYSAARISEGKFSFPCSGERLENHQNLCYMD